MLHGREIRGWTALGLEPAFGGRAVFSLLGAAHRFHLNGLRLLAFAIAGIPERQSAHCGMVDAIFSEPRLVAGHGNGRNRLHRAELGGIRTLITHS